jgi:spore coat protein CotF
MMAQNTQGGQQQGQQMGQQPGGQGMQQLSDRDILQVCLNECKHKASSLNVYIQEATSEQLRRDYMTVLGDVYSQEQQLFELMQQKGYYNVKNASAQEISQVKNKFSGQGQQGQGGMQ